MPDRDTRLPDDLTGRQCFLIDPMLATGGTLVAATHYLAERGAKDVTAVCILAAPEGIEFVEKNINPSIEYMVVGIFATPRPMHPGHL